MPSIDILSTASIGGFNAIIKGSNIYAQVFPNTTPYIWRMYKFAADIDVSVFTRLDSSNEPNFGTDFLGAQEYFDGTIIHSYGAPAGVWKYWAFDTSDDTWAVSTPESLPTTEQFASYTFPIVANGKFYVCGQGSDDSVMGGSYDRWSLFERDAGTWSELQPSSFPGGETSHTETVYGLFPHGADAFWILWKHDGEAKYYMTKFDASAGTFGTATELTGFAVLLSGYKIQPNTQLISTVYYHSFSQGVNIQRISVTAAGAVSFDLNIARYAEAPHTATNSVCHLVFDGDDSTLVIGGYRLTSDTTSAGIGFYNYDETLDEVSDYSVGDIDEGGEDSSPWDVYPPPHGLQTDSTDYDYISWEGTRSVGYAGVKWSGVDLASAADAITGAWASPVSLFYATTGAFDVANITGAFLSPGSIFTGRTFDFYQNAHAFGLAYNIPATLIRPDYKVFFAVIDTGSGLVSVPMIRFTVRRIGANIQVSQTGSLTIDLIVPGAYADTLVSNVGKPMTIHSTGNYQGDEFTIPIAVAEISKVTILSDTAAIYCEREYVWTDRPDSRVELNDFIFRSTTQVRTLFRSDVEPGMSVNVQGVAKVVNQVTMYADTKSALTDYIYRN